MTQATVKSTAVEAAPGPDKTDQRAGKYLSFRLAKEEFAIDVLSVREIMGMQHITAVAQTPSYVKGVINLRGKVIPVIDLRVKFGLPEAEYTHRTCIVVVQLETQAGKLLIGSIVDAVSGVLTLREGDIEDTPDFGDGSTTPFLLGMAKSKGKVKLLLDIDRIFTAQELSGMEAVFN